MIEAIAEHDDELMAAWVAGRELPAEPSSAALRRVTLADRGVPTLVGAAFKNQGIHNLLDAVIDYLPSPADVARSAAATSIRRRADDRPRDRRRRAARRARVQGAVRRARQPAHVRPRLHRLPQRRRRGAQRDEGPHEQIGRLVRMFANHREDIRQIEAGMIGAVARARARQARDRRHALRSALADPARSDRGAEPGDGHRRRARDRRRSREARRSRSSGSRSRTRASASRPTPTPARSSSRGMGELHLEIVVDRLRREFGVNARVGNPQVAYRETVTRRAEGENKFVARQRRGPRGEYGHVRLVVEPTDRGGGYVYENRAPQSDIPRRARPGRRGGSHRGRRARRPRRPPDDRPPRPGRRRQLSPRRFEQLRVQGRRDPRPSSRRPTRPARPSSSR